MPADAVFFIESKILRMKYRRNAFNCNIMIAREVAFL